MKWAQYQNRRVAEIENEELLLSVTAEGGHVARLQEKKSGVNPLWVPHWPSLEPSAYNQQQYPEYGTSGEAQLVAGLLGHCICLDLFGGPSASEEAAGIPAHGEAPVAPYEITGEKNELTLRAEFPVSRLAFERRIRLCANGVVHFTETLTNNNSTDRPIGWTQHVTLGAPFLQPGKTRFLLDAGRSRVIDASFNNGLGMQLPDADFAWPFCPQRDGSSEDLSTMTSKPVSAGFTGHQMNPEADHVGFAAWSPESKVLLGYAWRQKDYPWLARWEENHLRPWAPWQNNGYALGMEFGVSPFVKNRREMVELGPLFGSPTCAWIGAGETRTIEYVAYIRTTDALPTAAHWDGAEEITLQFASH